MLKHRLVTGPLLIALLLAVVVLDDWLEGAMLTGAWRDLFAGREHPPAGLLLYAVALIVAALGAIELSRIFTADGIASRRWLNALAAMLGVTVSYAIPQSTHATDTVAIVSMSLVIVFVTSIFIFSQNRNVRGVIAAAGAVMFTMVYLGLMMGFLLALRRWHSGWFIVGVILTTKAADMGAYFTGRAMGRRKLIAWLSPGKTWEGLAGGIVAATLVGAALSYASRSLLVPVDHVPLWLGALCGFLFALVGLFGDLTMSLLKRGAGMKDSSALLPGMGGVLDVLDSPLMVAPVAYWLFEWFAAAAPPA